MAWFNLHCHSQYSALDAMTPVADLVGKAHELGYPALGLSDHGNMAGATKLYLECKKLGLKPFPGEEFYLIDPRQEVDLSSKEASKARRFHFGMHARTTHGYQGMVKLSSLTHTRPRFNRFPRLTLEDLRDFGQTYGDDVIITTGCYFGWLVQTLEEDGEDAAAGVLEQLTAFGYSDVFVELQHHSIEDESHNDDDLVDTLVKLAGDLDYPVIATADNHYLDQKQKSAHALMKRMVYGGADDEFPGDSFHLPSAEWVEEHYTPTTWKLVEESCDYLLDRHDLTIPLLDNYRPMIPKVAPRPDRVLNDAVMKGLVKKSLTTDDYIARAKHELSVIKDLGMADYFLHYQGIIEFCTKRGIAKEARGSANGSLVCFALDVTSVDPIKWNCLFERFLSRDRTKPPDIDLDVEDTRKSEVVGYLRQYYNVMQIGTWGLLGANDDGSGSAIKTYTTYRAKQAETDERRKATYARYNARGLEAIEEDYPDDADGLKQISTMNSVYRSYGVHPAGLLLTTADVNTSDWIPTMLVASSDTTVTQYNMDDLEQWGFLKDDILGQATLRIMRRTMEMMGAADPTDFTTIPDNYLKAFKVCRTGRTDTGIFHVEAWTKSKGAKELGVCSVADLILMQALYMPGAMQSGATKTYLERRRAVRKPRIDYVHPIWKDVLDETLGVVVYQEQVIEIMRRLGMSIETINVLFKVVKDSGRGSHERNVKRMDDIWSEFKDHALIAGIDTARVAEAWESLVGMMNYGFNRAHATGYGIRSYRTAWMKAKKPSAFMCAVLEVASGKGDGGKRERAYQTEARRSHLRLLPPHVNDSDVSWTLIDHKNLRRGLLSIKGVGIAAAQAIVDGQPYSSIDDLARRLDAKAVSGGKAWLNNRVLGGRMKDLNDAGAFRELPESDPDDSEAGR